MILKVFKVKTGKYSEGRMKLFQIIIIVSEKISSILTKKDFSYGSH